MVKRRSWLPTLTLWSEDIVFFLLFFVVCDCSIGHINSLIRIYFSLFFMATVLSAMNTNRTKVPSYVNWRSMSNIPTSLSILMMKWPKLLKVTMKWARYLREVKGNAYDTRYFRELLFSSDDRFRCNRDSLFLSRSKGSDKTSAMLKTNFYFKIISGYHFKHR